MKLAYSDRIMNIIFKFILVGFSVFCLLPFLLVFISSITDEITLLKYGYSIFPKKISFDAYKIIFSTPTIYKAYYVTIFTTCVGTIASVLVTASMGYALSQRQLKYRNHLNLFAYFTMLFGGGLVPSYILISKYLGMKDTIWVYIIPFLLNPWNMFLLRNFFSSQPRELSESAKIDGANDVTIFYKIALPIAKPAIATISLFYALAFWNDWFTAVLYIENDALQSLQYLIMKLMRNISETSQFSQYTDGSVMTPSYGIQLATTIVTIGPIIFLYPFLQRYFIAGLTIGAVKG